MRHPEYRRSVTFHVFSDGCGIVDLGGSVSPQQVDEFTRAWERRRENKGGAIFIQGYEITIIEHQNPLGINDVRVTQGGTGDE